MTTEHPVEGPVEQPPTEESRVRPDAEPEPEQPTADQPDELISPEVAPRLTLDESQPEAPPAPDLAAVEREIRDEPPAQLSLDLPSLELPNPAPPIVPPARPVSPPAPPVPGGGISDGDYAENSARAAYGQPTPQPSPQPPSYTQPPYAESPYAQQQHAQQYPEPPYQPQYPAVPPAYGLVPNQQLSPVDENTWATAAHWSAILASVVGLGFLGPLLVLLIQGPKSARVRANAVESLNFEITFIISMIASVILMLAAVGFVTIFVFPILWLILRIVASVQTSSGRDYRYPVNIRLVK